jgi:hypothetical protein
MKNIGRISTYLIGIVSVAFLAYAILFRPTPALPPENVQELEPDSAFVHYMTDGMDYKTDFSKILVDERIAHLEKIALVYPDKKSEAYRFIDSLNARLERGAVIVKQNEDE